MLQICRTTHSDTNGKVRRPPATAPPSDHVFAPSENFVQPTVTGTVGNDDLRRTWIELEKQKTDKITLSESIRWLQSELANKVGCLSEQVKTARMYFFGSYVILMTQDRRRVMNNMEND